MLWHRRKRGCGRKAGNGMSEHVYVLGSNSFSGGHFIRMLLDMGYRVTGVSRSPEAHPVFLPHLAANGRHRNGYDFLRVDINRDMPSLLARMERDKPAYIVNFAAQGMVAESWEHPEQWLLTNTVSPVILHNKLRQYEWLSRFVQISTPEVYGATQGMLVENTCYNPSTPYAVSKAAVDMSLMCFYRAYDFPVVFTRAANVFGPCQQLYRIVPRAVLCFLAGGILQLHGGGRSRRCFIHIEDVARATHEIMTRSRPGSIFHIANPRIISIRDLVFLVADMVGVSPEKHITVAEERLGKDLAYTLDSSKLRAELDWREQYSLEQGIEDVIRWVRDNLSVLRAMPQNYEHRA